MLVEPRPQAKADAIRVMLVDDSAVVRGLVTRWLEAEPDIEVVSSQVNGAQAVKAIATTPCDIVVLDIEMPEMDGIAALPRLLAARPGLKVIMSSTLTRRNADISLKALALGAAETIAKPESVRAVSTSDEFRGELLAKIRALAPPRGQRAKGPASMPAASAPAARGPALQLRQPSRQPPQLLAIGSSTGGPNALFEVMSGLKGRLKVPAVLTQHMPATFTALLAEHITRVSGVPASEALEGEPLKPGHVLVAPGDHHMTLQRRGSETVIALDQRPRINFCRPAVDPLFASAAEIFGAHALCLVLTGMGCDGREGARAVAARGGTVIAQDEATSVVWGMPGAVAQAGLASAVLPLPRIAAALIQFLEGSAYR